MPKDTGKKEPKTLDEIKTENEALYTQLTNKNQNYMFQLNSQLEALDYDETKKAYVFNNMYGEIIAAQASSITARKIYGTVSDQADNILGKKVNVNGEDGEKSSDKLIYLDGALLMGGFFNVLQGFTAMRSMGAQVGIIQVILNFILGGLAIMLLTRFVPKPGQKKGLLKYAGATMVVIVSWTLLMAMLITVLRPLNLIIPGALVLIIGLAGIAAKWYFKKKFDIKGTLF